MLEQVLIRHCAPTLAGIKVANLFCYKGSLHELEEARITLEKRGIHLHILRQCKGKLIYVYRKRWLEEILSKTEHQHFLKSHGHHDFSVDALLASFEKKLLEKAFPHEIGLLLGYPLEDVRGFMESGGGSSCCEGYWKVYGDQKKAMDVFARYKRCTATYVQHYQQGSSLAKLAVAF